MSDIQLCSSSSNHLWPQRPLEFHANFYLCICAYMFMLAQVFMHICMCVYMHVETGSQCQMSFINSFSTLHCLRQSLSLKWEHVKSVRLAGQQVLWVFLFLPLTLDHSWALSHLALTWVSHHLLSLKFHIDFKIEFSNAVKRVQRIALCL